MTARNDVEWRPLVALEDQSSSYVHGFEAGMIWQRMQDSETEIDAVTHTENRQTLMNMANAAGGMGTTATTQMPGNPLLGALGGWSLGSSLGKAYGG